MSIATFIIGRNNTDNSIKIISHFFHEKKIKLKTLKAFIRPHTSMFQGTLIFTH